MKQRISRFAPHQNAKTVAILMAITSLIFFVPFFLLAAAFGQSQAMGPMWVIFIVPIIYLIFGYIGVVIGCAIYNVLVPITGGLEFDSADPGPR